MALTYPVSLFQLIFPLHLALLLTEEAVLALLKCEWAPLREIYLVTLKALWRESKCCCQLGRP